jgi:glutathione S-transferase
MVVNTTTPQPRLKLWYSPGACSFAPHALLCETGLDFELILSMTGQFTEEFVTQVNPKRRVPVLALDGEIITELPAIVTAISTLAPDRKLLGQTPLETVQVYEWLNYLSCDLHGQGYGGLWRPERFVDDPNLYPQIQDKAMKTIQECYALIESKFAATKPMYTVGDAFTVVDPFLFVCYRWGVRVKLDMATIYPNLTAWADRFSKRQSIIRARECHSKV